MVKISTSCRSLLLFLNKRVFVILITLFSASSGFSQLFVQATTQTDAQGMGLGVPMVGVPAPNVIFSSAGKVNGGFDLGSLTPCTFGYSGFTSLSTITTYSTSGPAIEITLSPSSNYFISCSGFSAKMRHSSTGPTNATFAYSIDGGTTWINNGVINLPEISCQNGNVYSWNFTCPVIISDIQNIKIRIYVYGSTGPNGSTQIENLTVNGTSSPCSSLNAAISGSTTICAGSSTNITISGTPLSTVIYNINGGANQTILLDCSGSSVLNTGALAATANYNITGIQLGNCSKALSGSAVVSVIPQISTAVISGTNTICSGSTTNLSVNITGGVGPYTVVYSDGVTNTTINNYTNASNIPVSPVVNTTYTLVSVTGSAGCTVPPAMSGSAVISMAPASTAAVISGTGSICTGSSTNLFINITAGVSPFTVVYFNGVSNTTINNYNSGTAIPVSPVVNTTYTIVSVASSNGCAGTGLSGSAVISVSAPGVWKGINTNWNDPLNWCDGLIPTATSDVTIPVSANYPLINTGSPQVRNITLSAAASRIDIAATGVFSIAGTITSAIGSTISNSGSLVMNGTSGVQNFPVTGLSLPVMNNLTINNPSGVNMANNLGVSGTLTLTNGLFTVGAFTLSIANPLAGTITNLSANNTSSINIGGTVPGVNLPASVSQLKNFGVLNSSGTVLQGNLNISTLLQAGAAAGTINAGSFTLNGTGGLTMTGGNLLLSKDAVVLPELTGTYNLTGGTVTFNGSGTGLNAQTVRPVNYFNLTSTSTGDRILSNSGTIGIRNVFTPSTNLYTITGSTVNFLKAAAQNLPKFTFNNLTLSGGNFTKSLTDHITVKGTLSIAVNTKLALGDYDVTLSSDLANTAAVDKILAINSITYGNGKFIVERYIPTGINHAKTWQFLSVPTTTGQTIKDAWQETATGGPSDNPKPGFGTQLTSNLTNALALGFDFYTPAGPSMKQYNSSSGLWDGVSSALNPVSNTNGYMLFVRGDRSVTAYNQAAVPTTLRTKGKLYAPGSDAPSSVSVSGGKFASIGNPYASAISLTVVSSLFTGDIQNIFYVWDPLLSSGPNSAFGLGGFRTLTYNAANLNYDVTPAGGSYGSTANNIQSGQAFIVKSFVAGGTVNFTENCKVLGSAMVNRPVNGNISKLRTNLLIKLNDETVLADGVMLKMADGHSNALDKEDATKIMQSAENFSIYSSGELLSVESKAHVTESDTINFHIGKLKQQTYVLEFIPENLVIPYLSAYLVDRYMNTRTEISMIDTTRLLFESFSNIPGSYAENRFFVVFSKKQPALNLSFVDIWAKRNMFHSTLVEWKVENEIAVKDYVVERSWDGINFSRAGIVLHIPGHNLYSFNDDVINSECIYYRIKATGVDGRHLYSKICKIDAAKKVPLVYVYPNPVINKTIVAYLRYKSVGEYQVQIYNNLGQEIMNKQVFNTNSMLESFVFPLGNTASSGVYKIRIVNNTGDEDWQQVLIK